MVVKVIVYGLFFKIVIKGLIILIYKGGYRKILGKWFFIIYKIYVKVFSFGFKNILKEYFF